MAQVHTVERPDTSGDACQHHWVIDTPSGNVSGGRCKRCGATKEFRNSTDELTWDSDSFSLNGSRYRGRRSHEITDDLS